MKFIFAYQKPFFIYEGQMSPEPYHDVTKPEEIVRSPIIF